MSNLKPIRITKNNYTRIYALKNGSVDNKLNYLMDEVEAYMPDVEFEYDEKKTIKVSQKTLNRVDEFRLTPKESRENILTRMILMYDVLINENQNFIYFKLVCNFNKELIITGRLGKKTKILNYTIDGENYTTNVTNPFQYGNTKLCDEFKSWEDTINWKEVVKSIIYSEDDLIKSDTYTIELNYL